MSTLRSFWRDEGGSVLSAEAVALATIAVLGVTVGASTAVNAVSGEFADFAQMMRSLNQSFSYNGISSSSAVALGSTFEDNVGEDVAGVQFQQISPQAVNDIAGALALRAQANAKDESADGEKSDSGDTKKKDQLDELLPQSNSGATLIPNQNCEI